LPDVELAPRPTPRPRCAEHHLVLRPDGTCARCVSRDERSTGARMLAIGVGVILATTVAFVAVRMVNRAQAAQADRAPSMARTKAAVTMYSTEHCPHCRNAKKWLDQHGVSYEEKRVDTDEDALREFAALKTGGGVPTFVVQGEVLRGFDPEGRVLGSALRRHGVAFGP
jgi:glutaredoxin 3